MGQPVVHFEIVGKDGAALKRYYSELFGWAINSDNPMDYGIVAKARVRATRASRGFEHRVTVPDWAGADAVSARAVSPAGETCTVSGTVPGS